MPQPTSDVPSEPEGLVIEAVEWLPSGTEGGLIRVRGDWQPGSPHPEGLPVLCARRGEEVMRWDSLPDSRVEPEGGVWRGAYLVPAALVDDAPDALWLEWPGNVRATIAPPRPETPAPEADAEAAEVGGEVIDRAVLAERRARRAEAAEEEQARKATTALHALEALELRAGELERRLAEATAERDDLVQRLGEPEPAAPSEPAPAAPPDAGLPDLQSDLDEARAARERAEARADRQRQALTGALASAAHARAQARDWRLRLRTSEVARASDAVRLAVIESEQDLRLELQAERRRARQRAEALDAARAAAAAAAAEHERAGAELERRLAAEGEGHAQTRRRVDELVDELGETRAELQRVQAALGPARTEAARVPGLEARVDELERGLATASADLEAARAEADMIGSRLSAQSVARAALETELEREREMRVGVELEEERRRREDSSEAALVRDLGLARADLATVRSDLDEARTDRDAARAQIAGMRSQLDAAASRMDGFQAQLEAARSERDGVEAQLRAAEAERDGFRTELEAARSSQEQSGTDMAAARAEQERLRTELQAEQERTRAEAERSRALAELEAEHARTRDEFEAQRERLESEHARAREELAELQAQQDRAEAERGQTQAELQAERDRAEAERRRALADLEAEHARQRADLDADRERAEAEHARARAALQAERDGLRKGLELAHAERDRAQVELAAARAQRDGFRAELEAARAARDRAQAELSAARQREASRLLASPTFPERAAAETDPAALRERARLQAEAAARAAAQPAPTTQRMVADLDAAAATLRHDVGDPLLHPERAIPEPEEPEVEEEEAASGWLRHALARFAAEDPRGAGELIAGLLPAQGPAIGGPVDYDLTIREIGTFAVMVWSRRARIQRLTGPRSRREAAFHIEADARSLAELLAGIGRVRRFRGDARISGKRRRAKVLNALPTCDLSLADAVRAGATLDPGPLFRTLRYAIDPAWTVGHSFTVAQRILDLDSETWYISIRDGKPLAVTDVAPLSGVDATVTMSSDTYYAMLRGEALPPGERPNVRGDYGAVALLKAWTDRAQAADSEK